MTAPPRANAPQAPRRSSAEFNSTLRATCPRSRASWRRLGVPGSVRSASSDAMAHPHDQGSQRRRELLEVARHHCTQDRKSRQQHQEPHAQGQGKTHHEDVHLGRNAIQQAERHHGGEHRRTDRSRQPDCQAQRRPEKPQQKLQTSAAETPRIAAAPTSHSGPTRPGRRGGHPRSERREWPPGPAGGSPRTPGSSSADPGQRAAQCPSGRRPAPPPCRSPRRQSGLPAPAPRRSRVRPGALPSIPGTDAGSASRRSTRSGVRRTARTPAKPALSIGGRFWLPNTGPNATTPPQRASRSRKVGAQRVKNRSSVHRANCSEVPEQVCGESDDQVHHPGHAHHQRDKDRQELGHKRQRRLLDRCHCLKEADRRVPSPFRRGGRAPTAARRVAGLAVRGR